MTCIETVETVALHDTLEPFTLGDALEVDVLADLEVGSLNQVSERVLFNTFVVLDKKLGDMAFGSDLGPGEMAEQRSADNLVAVGLELAGMRVHELVWRDVLHADLDSGIAVLLKKLVVCDLAAVDLEYGAGEHLALWCEPSDHAELLCESTGASR